MNIHPRYRKIYLECSTILNKIISKKTTLKTEIYKNKKPASYIPIIEKVLQNYEILNKVISETKFFKNDQFYSLIVCNEIINGKLNNDFWKSKFESVCDKDLLKHNIKQKYIRINTLKGTVNDLKNIKLEKTKLDNIYKLLEPINFKENMYYKKGIFVVQNISSCLPALLLDPKPTDKIIDACAAPGNKTSHLSCLMNNEGKIFAVENDKQRFKILKNQISKLGIKNVKLMSSDFLEIGNDKLGKIDGILVDPSCSGSGIHDVYEKDDERLKNLQKFQIKLLKHAISFGADKIVYSTCSIHEEEGEEVVLESIKDSGYKIKNLAEIFKEKLFDGFEIKGGFIRCNSTDNIESNGFFAALLVKE